MTNTKTEDVINISGMGKTILKARKNIGWSRQVAAGYIGVSEQTLARWENGSTKFIKQESYEKLEDILNGNAQLEDDE